MQCTNNNSFLCIDREFEGDDGPVDESLLDDCTNGAVHE